MINEDMYMTIDEIKNILRRKQNYSLTYSSDI